MQHQTSQTQDHALESCLDCGAACLLGFSAEICAEAPGAVKSVAPAWSEMLESRIARYTAWSDQMHQEGKLLEAGVSVLALQRCQMALDGLPSPRSRQRAHVQAAPVSGAEEVSGQSTAAQGADAPAAARAGVDGTTPEQRDAGARGAAQTQASTSAKRGPRRPRVNTDELDWASWTCFTQRVAAQLQSKNAGFVMRHVCVPLSLTLSAVTWHAYTLALDSSAHALLQQCNNISVKRRLDWSTRLSRSDVALQPHHNLVWRVAWLSLALGFGVPECFSFGLERGTKCVSISPAHGSNRASCEGC